MLEMCRHLANMVLAIASLKDFLEAYIWKYQEGPFQDN